MRLPRVDVAGECCIAPRARVSVLIALSNPLYRPVLAVDKKTTAQTGEPQKSDLKQTRFEKSDLYDIDKGRVPIGTRPFAA